jgi:hypothetical protein
MGILKLVQVVVASHHESRTRGQSTATAVSTQSDSGRPLIAFVCVHLPAFGGGQLDGHAGT